MIFNPYVRLDVNGAIQLDRRNHRDQRALDENETIVVKGISRPLTPLLECPLDRLLQREQCDNSACRRYMPASRPRVCEPRIRSWVPRAQVPCLGRPNRTYKPTKSHLTCRLRQCPESNSADTLAAPVGCHSHCHRCSGVRYTTVEFVLCCPNQDCFPAVIGQFGSRMTAGCRIPDRECPGNHCPRGIKHDDGQFWP